MGRKPDLSNSELRRKYCASALGLSPSATWEDIRNAERSRVDAFILKTERKSKEGLKKFTNHYGLKKTADWDDVYECWKRKKLSQKRSIAAGALFVAIALGYILLKFSVHWVAWTIYVVIALAILGLGRLLIGLASEDEYNGLVHSAPEILERAKRDGIFD